MQLNEQTITTYPIWILFSGQSSTPAIYYINTIPLKQLDSKALLNI